ncbi:hypothetical protein [Stutzerimonas tarimensis]|uniref:Uncharacterized protein n=1 Tax=Stutzerimonas tarimensis TaxID=1507735 RepID=A0ABV7T744_9GAMM
MKKSSLFTLLISGVFATSALAQWPAGTPEERRGAYPSPSGNPTHMEELDTYTDSQGRVRTEEGYPVETAPSGDEGTSWSTERNDTDRFSSPGGPHDDATSPGTTE